MNSINKNLTSVKKNGVFDHDDDYVMYILINKDTLHTNISQLLSKSCGSLVKVIRSNENKYNVATEYKEWLISDETKIFLEATQEELLYAINNYSDSNKSIWCHHTLDLDNIDSPITVSSVAFTPMVRKDTPEFILLLETL